MTPSHRQRLLTALILVPVLATAILLGGAPLRLAATLVAVLGLGEFLAMFWDLRQRPLVTGLILTAGAGLMWLPATWPEALTAPLLALLLAGSFLLRTSHDSTAAADSAVIMAGLLTIPILLRLGLQLPPLEIGFVVLATMASDTAAFYTGTRLGGPKLWPRVSPKKTWSGSLGGLTACIGLCTIYGMATGTTSILPTILVAAALGLAAQVGDLAESALKRWRNIKDSGILLPGHGGILDRIDSLLAAIPVYVALRYLIRLWE